MRLNAQCFHSFTCLRIKSECVRGEGFSYFVLFPSRKAGGGVEVRGEGAETRFDKCCEGAREVGWCLRGGCRGLGTGDWLWPHPRGAAPEDGRK